MAAITAESAGRTLDVAQSFFGLATQQSLNTNIRVTSGGVEMGTVAITSLGRRIGIDAVPILAGEASEAKHFHISSIGEGSVTLTQNHADDLFPDVSLVRKDSGSPEVVLFNEFGQITSFDRPRVPVTDVSVQKAADRLDPLQAMMDVVGVAMQTPDRQNITLDVDQALAQRVFGERRDRK